ncbi:hypothetical protein HZB01_02780 [Candidatus Woesearchaeota archaeon]|nr:hypothetical protein [Candidatus Woesearchaeota archaeon]
MPDASDTTLRIALIQTAASTDIAANLKKTAAFIRTAKAKKAEIVCLQELFATPYFCQTESKVPISHSEYLPGKTSRWLT